MTSSFVALLDAVMSIGNVDAHRANGNEPLNDGVVPKVLGIRDKYVHFSATSMSFIGLF
jgi:hypothetical protein